MIQNNHPLNIELDRIVKFYRVLSDTKKPKIHLAELESMIKNLIANTIFTDLEKVELYTNILLQPSVSEEYISKIIDDLSNIQDKNKTNDQIDNMIKKISLSLAKRLNGISNLKIDRIVDRLSIKSRLKVYHSITQSQRTIRTLNSIVLALENIQYNSEYHDKISSIFINLIKQKYISPSLLLKILNCSMRFENPNNTRAVLLQIATKNYENNFSKDDQALYYEIFRKVFYTAVKKYEPSLNEENNALIFAGLVKYSMNTRDSKYQFVKSSPVTLKEILHHSIGFEATNQSLIIKAMINDLQFQPEKLNKILNICKKLFQDNKEVLSFINLEVQGKIFQNFQMKIQYSNIDKVNETHKEYQNAFKDNTEVLLFINTKIRNAISKKFLADNSIDISK